MSGKRFAALVTLLFLSAPPGGATAEDAGGVLLGAPQDQACGPASPAPCPTPGQADANPAAPVPKPGAAAAKAVGVGGPAKPFKLTDLDGATVSFDPKGLTRPTLVIFWSLFCAPCKEEFPLYGELAERYAPQGLDVVTVNVDGAGLAKTARSFLKQQGVSVRVLMDRKEGKRFYAADAYGVTGTPSLFLVDKGGTVRWKHAGRVAQEELEAAVRKSLSGS